MIAIFAAMQPEVSACLGCFAAREDTALAGYPAVRGDLAVVCQTGMGRRAEQCVAAVLPALSPSAVLSVGVAGGLHHDRRAGEIILCERVDHAEARGSAPEAKPATSSPVLIEAAQGLAHEIGLPARPGSCVTVDSVAWTPAEKSDLHSWLSHDVVEMESYWIGLAAAARGLPFLAVRVVSDQAGDQLVDSGSLKDDGSFDQVGFQAFMRERPDLIPVFTQQMERNRLAIANLTAFVTALLPRIHTLVAREALHD